MYFNILKKKTSTTFYFYLLTIESKEGLYNCLYSLVGICESENMIIQPNFGWKIIFSGIMKNLAGQYLFCVKFDTYFYFSMSRLDDPIFRYNKELDGPISVLCKIRHIFLLFDEILYTYSSESIMYNDIAWTQKNNESCKIRLYSNSDG